MENFKPENYGERWIKYIVQQNWGKHWHFIFLVVAVFFGYLSIQDINSLTPTIPVMFLFLATIYFERWHFSNILRKQQAQIESLRAELKTAFPEAKADSRHSSEVKQLRESNQRRRHSAGFALSCPNFWPRLTGRA